ncbi:MAG: hypothetical protein Q9214_004170 [Letrouitia sp. 1 TL-2023]
MAPSSGHLLVPKAWKIIKFAAAQTGEFLRSRLPPTSGITARPAVQAIHIPSKSHPIRYQAFLKQTRSQSRQFSRSFHGSVSRVNVRAGQYDRAAFQSSSKIGQVISRTYGMPFASTLRPNLTGGALPRSSGGYCLGGVGRGIRHFSHIPSPQAQVVQNVNAGIRAFCLGGGKARFDGINLKTGEKKYKAVTETEDQVLQKTKIAGSNWVKGTSLEFQLTPTITALAASLPESTTSISHGVSLGTAGLLDNLAVDFARSLKDLSVILMDLKRLAVFGDLPINLSTSPTGGIVLSVRFCGCDGEIISRLCDEAGIHRGIVREDEGWSDDRDVDMALLFPFAPSGVASENCDEARYTRETFRADGHYGSDQLDWRQMMSPPDHDRDCSTRTLDSFEHVQQGPASLTSINRSFKTPSRSSSDYENLLEAKDSNDSYYCAHPTNPWQHRQMQAHEEFEGLEGIYKFLRECEQAKR